MAAIICRISKDAILKANPALFGQQAKNVSFKSIKSLSKGKKVALAAALTTGGVVAFGSTVFAAEMIVHPPSYPWSHSGIFESFDMNSVRRGYEVYKQVCAACHSLEYVCFRHMVGQFMTENEAKEEAKEAMIKDGPDEEGNMFERPGKLSDRFPSPYPNEMAARFANNGALPPDLSFIVSARHGHEDYIFSLLTGYCDPPAGVTLGEDMHYNPYFAGGSIAMAQALYDEIIEYEDGTPATQSQLAKDVTTFLAWCGDLEHDTRKETGMKAVSLISLALAVSYFWKRRCFSYLKTKNIEYRPR